MAFACDRFFHALAAFMGFIIIRAIPLHSPGMFIFCGVDAFAFVYVWYVGIRIHLWNKEIKQAESRKTPADSTDAKEAP